MKFAGAGVSRYAQDVRCVDAAAWDDENAPNSDLDQLGQSSEAFGRSGRAAGRQNASRPGLDDVFERFAQIRGDIKSAMECDRQRPRKPDELLRAFDVNMAILFQYAEHHAIHAKLLGSLDVALNGCKLSAGINKVAAARANHRKDRQRHLLADRAHQCGPRRQPFLRQAAAQLDPMRAATLCGERGVKCLDGNFQNVGVAHRELA